MQVQWQTGMPPIIAALGYAAAAGGRMSQDMQTLLALCQPGSTAALLGHRSGV